MLSRLSSFSGPLSPTFRIPVGGFTADGLILRYVIEDTELLDALSSYMNYQSKKGGLKIANDVDTWEDAEQEFLIVKPETLEAIGSKTLREKAKQFLGLN